MATPLNFILVEDNPHDVLLLRTVLKNSGFPHDLLVLEDGEKAIKYVRELASAADRSSFPDLVFLDLNLPKKNGHEVLTEIRKYPELRSIPVVVLTTSEDPLDHSKVLAQDATCCVSKPPDLEMLCRIFEIAEIAWCNIGSLETLAAESDSKSSPSESGSVGNKQHQKILLIEDNPHDTLLITKLLAYTAPGLYEITAVTDLKSAFALLVNESFTVIITDLGLPDAQGMQVLTKLLPFSKKVPIIILTGLDNEAIAAEAVEQGAQDYLVKGSLAGDTLLRSIRYALMRKRAEALAQQAVTFENSVLQEILENAPMSIARFNADLTISACNTIFQQLLKVSSSSIIGRSIQELLPDVKRELWHQIIDGGIPFSSEECRIAQGDAPELLWDLMAWPIKTRNNDIKGGIIIGLDVTQRIKLERQRDDFIAALAHDIKNPLLGTDRVLKAVIDGSLGKLEAHHENVLSAVQNSNENVLTMLHNLLDVYRYEATAVSLAFVPVDVVLVANTVIASLSNIISERKLRINCQFDTALKPIIGDTSAIHRLFSNLLHNALMFSKEGDSIELSGQNNGPDSVLIRIIDHGIGMQPEEQQFLFKRFGQAKSTQYKVGPGTGLGLYLCKQIVEAHHGTIICNSLPNEGCTFEVTLPALQN
ncbi:hypothetical protein BH10CYA1_BH10CYA1_46420 [soil metagenome]